jgi:hypothetical protein
VLCDEADIEKTLDVKSWEYYPSKSKKKPRKIPKPRQKTKKLTQPQTTHPQQKHNFYPRVINNTDMPFSKCEMNLLQKGLKYNLHTKQANWIQNLALEAETAIQSLPASDRDIYRHTVAKRLNTLQRNSNTQPNPKIAQVVKFIVHDSAIINSVVF